MAASFSFRGYLIVTRGARSSYPTSKFLLGRGPVTYSRGRVVRIFHHF